MTRRPILSPLTFAIAVFWMLLMYPGSASAYDAVITWEPAEGSEQSVSGYKVYVRQGPTYDGTVPINVGLIPPDQDGLVRYTVVGLPMGPTNWFAVTSYDSSFVESLLSNEVELGYAQVAQVVDSDGDGLVDAQEDVDLDGVVDPGETDPDAADSDTDGLDDGEEVNVYGTDPLDADSDGDGDADGFEVVAGTDPNDVRSSSAVCGDASVSGGEECDDGAGNSSLSPYSCQSDCTLPPVCGDASGNRTLSVTDGLEIMRASIGVNPHCPFSECDVNGDGNVSVVDAAKVVHAAVGEPLDLDCGLAVSLVVESDVAAGTVDLAVDYSATGSAFVGDGQEVECQAAPSLSSLAVFDNRVGISELLATISLTQPVTAGTAVATCRFYAKDDVPVIEDFTVEVLSSSEPSLPVFSVLY